MSHLEEKFNSILQSGGVQGVENHIASLKLEWLKARGDLQIGSQIAVMCKLLNNHLSVNDRVG